MDNEKEKILFILSNYVYIVKVQGKKVNIKTTEKLENIRINLVKNMKEKGLCEKSVRDKTMN